MVYQSDGETNHPVSYTFTIGDENWKFEVTPKSGWRNATLLIIIIGIFLTISLLLSILTRVWLVAKEHRKSFRYWRAQILLQIFIIAMDLMNLRKNDSKKSKSTFCGCAP